MFASFLRDILGRPTRRHNHRHHNRHRRRHHRHRRHSRRRHLRRNDSLVLRNACDDVDEDHSKVV